MNENAYQIAEQLKTFTNLTILILVIAFIGHMIIEIMWYIDRNRK